MTSFHILTYGCQMNHADSARIRAICLRMGLVYTEDEHAADVLVFDTCSVKQKAEDKIHGRLKHLRDHQKARLTGCMIQHNVKNLSGTLQQHKKGNFIARANDTEDVEIIGLRPDDPLEASPGRTPIVTNFAFNPFFRKVTDQHPRVELFFRIDDVAYLPQIATVLGYDVQIPTEYGPDYLNIFARDANKGQNSQSKTVYIPIQTGCNQFCSYCIVPYARGLEKNRSLDDIMTEVDHHIAQGAQEIVFLGQIVNKHPDFVDIIRQTATKSAVRWIRYTSPYPTFYDSDLLTLHADEPKLCPHIHMPVQSGSTAILKKMFRGYTRDQFIDFVDMITALERPISLTSDIIVGFPDETDDDFAQTLSLVDYAKFDMLYMSIYSPRPGTYAARKLTDSVPHTTKRTRRAELNDLLATISKTNNKTEVGNEYTMMVTQGRSDVSDGYGYTDNMKNIELTSSPHQGATTQRPDVTVGDFVRVRVTDYAPLKLYGELVDRDPS